MKIQKLVSFTGYTNYHSLNLSRASFCGNIANLSTSRIIMSDIHSQSPFSLDFRNHQIPIIIPPSLSLTKDDLLSFIPFTNWLNTLQQSITKSSENYNLRNIEIQSIDKFSKDKIGFIKLKAEFIHPNGKPLPGVVLLRGDTVGILVVLEPSDMNDSSSSSSSFSSSSSSSSSSDSDTSSSSSSTSTSSSNLSSKSNALSIFNNSYLLLVTQARLPAGTINLTELPAGMIDDGTFSGSAAKELEEECGIKIPESELIDLLDNKSILLSPGLIDESIKFFFYKKSMPLSQIKSLEGKLSGIQSSTENEVIQLKILKPIQAESTTRDAKLLLALSLYRRYINS